MFDPENRIGQFEVFSEVGVPMVNDMFNGENAAILAYGQTGSGKTYSILGRRN